MDLSNYDYFLPEKNLALEPAVPRDSSKLLIYDTAVDKIIFDHFYNLDKYLPKNSFMVMNNTKVLPARITMRKESGGKVVVLLLVNEIIDDTLPIIVDRKINVGEKIFFDTSAPSTLLRTSLLSVNSLDVIRQKENIFEVRFDFSREHLFALLKKYGTMPIPPYLKKSSLTRNQLLNKYQTIFARAPVGARLASAAAPTASLHFTEEVFKKLDKKGIKKYFITLHVGMGTFAPITKENIEQKKLHQEYFEVEEKTLRCIDTSKQDGKKLIAVGTTVVRTFESIARQRVFSSATPPRGPLAIPQKQLSSLFNSEFSIHNSKFISKTDLFIFPPYDFKMVDIMITNFHLPKSSLMMLVEAFLLFKNSKQSLVKLYEIAIKNNFRFYSFGDAMLIL